MTLHDMDDRAARHRVPALARGLAILEAVAAGPSSATAADLASRLGVPRNSIARLLRTLVRHAFLVVDPHGRYRPGPAAARVAAAYLGARPEVAHAQPVLDALCARSGLAAQLLGRDGAEVVVLAQAAPDGAACLITRVGARFAGRAVADVDVDGENDAAEPDGQPVRRLGRQGASRQAAGIVATPVVAGGALAIGVALDVPDDARWRQIPEMIGDAARRLSDALADPAEADHR
ncbi:IclR family transcriptional regulator [Burkholderia contaminans]|uniref:IclR family transcriptional regulator n=2 Tax=Burkholderia contaminans TaxID=488447 RepID=A0A6P2ZXJ6_9BURK|nr:IclR family transcriptional regulator [Burkholderia contaminans]